MKLWPFKKKPKLIEHPIQRVINCPPQQLITRKCTCISCRSRNQCYMERSIASYRNCENQWISYCSSLDRLDNRGNSGFNVIFGEYYLELKKRIVENG